MSWILDVVHAAFRAYFILIFVRIILSWVRHNPYMPVFRFIYEITEPYLRVFRRIIPPIGMIDLSPIVALLALQFIEYLVVRALFILI